MKNPAKSYVGIVYIPRYIYINNENHNLIKKIKSCSINVHKVFFRRFFPDDFGLRSAPSFRKHVRDEECYSSSTSIIVACVKNRPFFAKSKNDTF